MIDCSQWPKEQYAIILLEFFVYASAGDLGTAGGIRQDHHLRLLFAWLGESRLPCTLWRQSQARKRSCLNKLCHVYLDSLSCNSLYLTLLRNKVFTWHYLKSNLSQFSHLQLILRKQAYRGEAVAKPLVLLWLLDPNPTSLWHFYCSLDCL